MSKKEKNLLTFDLCHLTSAAQPLVIASHNKGKVVEIGELIAPLGIRVISATEANVDEPEETGDSFAANASLKSEYSSLKTGLVALADDSGLVVPAIGGAPGIYSARWAGPGKDFTMAFDRIQKELGDCPKAAYFVCMLALTIPKSPPLLGGRLGGGHSLEELSPKSPHSGPPPNGEGVTYLFEGRIDGTLTFPQRGEKGFGYDPIFIPDGHTETFAELDPHYKNTISHRAQAFSKFLAFLKDK